MKHLHVTFTLLRKLLRYCSERVQHLQRRKIFHSLVSLLVRRELANVSILGPVRKADQIELSATDARSIGVAAPIRESGDTAGSGACKLVGPCGEVECSEGVIVAKRHIHMTPADAETFGVKDKDIVAVKIESAERTAILCDTVIRVSDKFALAMHIDTDESNAVGAGREQYGEIVKL